MDGLDPTLGAILPLVGVVFGVLGSGIVQWRLRRRDERLEFRAVARLLVEELSSTAEYVEGRMEQPPYAGITEDAAMSVRRQLWEDHEVAVARHVDDGDAWRTISRGCTNGVVAVWGIASAIDRDGMRKAAVRVVEQMRAAALELWPYAYPDQAPDVGLRTDAGPRPADVVE
jgi:hypothetical protein